MRGRLRCASMVCGAAYVPMNGTRQILMLSASSLAISIQVITSACTNCQCEEKKVNDGIGGSLPVFVESRYSGFLSGVPMGRSESHNLL